MELDEQLTILDFREDKRLSQKQKIKCCSYTFASAEVRLLPLIIYYKYMRCLQRAVNISKPAEHLFYVSGRTATDGRDSRVRDFVDRFDSCTLYRTAN